MAGKRIDKGHLLKGRLLNDTDKLLANTDRARYEDRRKKLVERKRSLVDLAEDAKIIKPPPATDRHHAEKQWLGGPDEPDAWWPDIPDKEEILRQGFIKAYDLALQDRNDVKPKPIETYWIPGWGGFATVAIAGPGKKTTLLILTPPPPSGGFAGAIDRDMFVIASEETIESILAIYGRPATARKKAAKKATAKTAKKAVAKKAAGKQAPSRVRILQLKGA
jgi:hypothetical protein